MPSEKFTPSDKDVEIEIRKDEDPAEPEEHEATAEEVDGLIEEFKLPKKPDVRLLSNDEQVKLTPSEKVRKEIADMDEAV